MKVLVVGRYIGPGYGARGIQGDLLVKGLAADGHEVTVISGDGARREHGCESSTITSGYEAADYRLIGQVDRFFGRGGFTTKWSQFVVSAVVDTLHRGGVDAVISLSTPVESHLAVSAALMDASTPVPWLAFFSDPWPPDLMPRPYGRTIDRLLARFHRRRLTQVSSQCSAIACTSKRTLSLMKPAFKNCAATVLPHIVAPTAPAQQVEAENYILHAGTISKERESRYLARFIENAAKVLPAYGCKLRFLGADSKLLRSLDRDKRLGTSLEVLPRVPSQESIRIVQRARAHLIIEAEMESSPFMPSKITEAASTGMPILCITPRDSELRDTFQGDPRFAFLTHNECANARLVADAMCQLLDAKRSDSARADAGPLEEVLGRVSLTPLGAAKQVMTILGLTNA